MTELRAQLNQARLESNVSSGHLNYYLELFGDELAKREGYRDLDGLEALRYYLMQKHRWLPRDLNALSHDDIRFALSQEMAGWTVPQDAPTESLRKR